MNGLDGLAITKLDVLTGLDEVNVCVAYDTPRGRTRDLPLDDLDAATPVYRALPGWREPLSSARALADLPAAARDYVRLIEAEVEVPAFVLSVGPRRDETILLADAFARVDRAS